RVTVRRKRQKCGRISFFIKGFDLDLAVKLFAADLVNKDIKFFAVQRQREFSCHCRLPRMRARSITEYKRIWAKDGKPRIQRSAQRCRNPVTTFPVLTSVVRRSVCSPTENYIRCESSFSSPLSVRNARRSASTNISTLLSSLTSP